MRARRILSAVGVVLIAAFLLVVYRGQQERRAPRAVRPIGAVVQISAPLGLPPVPVPADNPPTQETITLGRRLYYDPMLSVDNTVSCASCHSPEFGFGDGKQFSNGVQNKVGTRNSPTVFNSAYYETQFWDGRSPSLEKQAEGPVQNPVEMAHTLKGVEERLNADPSYRAEFERAFGPGPITYEMVEKAIASFERTVVSANSPFDRYYFGGDKKALSPAAIRGFKVFSDFNKGNCTSCHAMDDKYSLFTDNKFHNVGVGVKGGEIQDRGRYDVTKNEADMGAFKTPSLRNVALTAPYFHDGSRKTLKEVVDFYVGGATSNPHLDRQIHALDFLTGRERADLQAFLESLTGEIPSGVEAPQQASMQRN